ncbi:MAG: nucleotidyltransferase family protein [Methyloligellaceae bacterium]
MLFPINIRSSSRIFPNYSWAWPTAHTEQLLRAAALKDEEVAKKLFKDWMTSYDIDDVHWKEQRLLLPIAARFSENDISVPNRARLNGLVRMFWTKSRLSLRSSEPAIQKLTNAGIEVLLFKGAARAASSQNNIKGRIISDVDILIRPAQFKEALRILNEDGWETKNGRSLCYAQTLADGIVGLNFIKGEFGDIDIHQSLFRVLGAEQQLDEDVWNRSSVVDFMGTQARIPCETDMLLIAIAHGSVDGHRHSDWIVDCDNVISSGNIDWDLFVNLIKKRNLAPHAAIVLSFLSHRLQSPIPEEVLEKVGNLGKKRLPALLSALLQARPLENHTIISSLGRSYFKRIQFRKQLQSTNPINRNTFSVIKMSKVRKVAAENKTIDTAGCTCEFEVPANAKGLTVTIKASMNVKKRRCVYELNSSDFHIARMMYRHKGDEGDYLLKARIPLPINSRSTQSQQVKFEARPRKLLVLGEEPEKADALGKLPFSIHSIDFW